MTYRELRQLLRDFILTEALNKYCAPSCCMVFMGKEVNTILFTLTIPRDKLEEILQVLNIWVSKSYASLNEVEKFAGLLNFGCVRSARIYLS